MTQKIKVLVTGGAGYIGSHVVKSLGERGYDVLTFDNLSTGHRESVIYGKLVIADLSDKEIIRKILIEYRPDAVIHTAASTDVTESIKCPLKYYKNNFCNTLNLVESCVESGVKHFVFSSSAAVYGIPDECPVSEEASLKPINPYGITKTMAEYLLEDLSKAEDFKYVSIRCFNAAGANEGGSLGERRQDTNNLITRAIRTALGKREFLEIFGTDYSTEDGTCIRDFIHVADVAEAHVLALEYLLDKGKSNTFNCGCGRGISVRDVINAVKEITGVNFRVVESVRREGDPPKVIADIRKIRSVLNWSPKHSDIHYIIRTAYKWEKLLRQ